MAGRLEREAADRNTAAEAVDIGADKPRLPAQHVVVPGFNACLAHDIARTGRTFANKPQHVRGQLLVGIDAHPIRVQAYSGQLPFLDRLVHSPRRIANQTPRDFRVAQLWITQTFRHTGCVEVQQPAQPVGDLKWVGGTRGWPEGQPPLAPRPG